MEAAVYYEKEVLVIDFTDKRKGRAAIINYFDKKKNEVIVTYSKRNWVYIHEDHPILMASDVDPYDEVFIKMAKKEDIEAILVPFKRNWFGKVIKSGYKYRLRNGWVELKISSPKNVVTTQYRIIN